MSDSDDPAAVSLTPSIGALVVTFLLVTLVAGTLLGFNWTQAVLFGGFAGTVAVASAWLTARRADD
jgi:ABC-type antimicrobial peptide transport system permease subunit